MADVAALQSDYLDPDVLNEVSALEIMARGTVEGSRIGHHRSMLTGLSTEFTHHRPYVPGDEVRHVDWRVYSRTERFYVRKYEAETNFEAHLLLDASASMQYAARPERLSKLEYAKHMAAALAYRVIDERDSAGLALFDDELRDYLPPRGSKLILIDLVRMLREATGAPRTNVGGILDEFAGRIKRRGFVMVFSDLLDEEEGFVHGLNHLAFDGHNVIVFHLLDRDELTFPFDGSVRFEDLEGDDQIMLEPDRVRAAYLEELQAMIDRYRRACENVNADYVLVDTSRPVREVIVEYLAARRVLSWGR